MHIVLKHDASNGFFGPRPIIRLATGTLTRALDAIEPGRVFKTIEGFSLGVAITRMEQVGNGVALDSPLEPGAVEHSTENNWLDVDIAYNEINMVLDRVSRDLPDGRSIPASRDYLDTFAIQIAAAMDAIIAWCDTNDAWVDRDAFLQPWNTAVEDLASGRLLRPSEFTLSREMRRTLDGAWALADAMPLDDERFESLAEAYFLLRDVGWQDANYEPDPDAEATEFGQPARLSNYADNLASAPPPDASHGYSPY